MGKLISGVSRWIGGKVVTFLLILSVLVAGAWIKNELKTLKVLSDERGVLVAMKDKLVVQISEAEAKASSEFAQLTKTQLGLQNQVKNLEQNRASIFDDFPVAVRVPFTSPWKNVQLYNAQIDIANAAITASKSVQASVTKELNTVKTRINAEIAELQMQIGDNEERRKGGYVGQVLTVIYRDFPMALFILAGVILTPIGIKVFFYFVVAPWATGRQPIRILPEASGDISSKSGNQKSDTEHGSMSAISQVIVLGENQELIIQPEFLQSTSHRTKKKTKWLLNSSFPFASVLSGMYMLTRVHPHGSDPVVISATKDSYSEVGILDLSDGSAFVCQPRALVGVIQDRTKPVRITRHWRLGSLQSWLTLQLRFLAFHGPGQLVMKGCRGIRIESAGTGRLINQAATMGFSANIDYGNTRCETFVSYWSGKEDLFNDLFTGSRGVYVYEETPSLSRHSGVTGRGLEGLTDALLKVFGV